jgi:RNA polymerase sigma factor (sigma-70 family)
VNDFLIIYMQQLLPDDSKLLDQLRCHDSEAFELLYSKYWKCLYDFARAKTRDSNVAEEIIQDLFVTVWEKCESLLVVNLQSYLFTVVRNKIIDYNKEKIFSELEYIESISAPDYPIQRRRYYQSELVLKLRSDDGFKPVSRRKQRCKIFLYLI